MTHDIENIWLLFHKELKSFIYNKTRNLADTDDILQDAFLKIIRNIEKVNHAENLRQYLYRIVGNVINDYFRNKKKMPCDPISEELTESENHSLNETIAEHCIKPLLNKLPEIYKEALLIAEFENISQKEMAQRLNISYSGAKSRVQRGKDKLKELITNCCAVQTDMYGNLMYKEKNNCQSC